jgi:hypothetical protein
MENRIVMLPVLISIPGCEVLVEIINHHFSLLLLLLVNV